MHDLLTRTIISLLAIATTNSAVGETVVLPRLRRRGFHWMFGNIWWADRAIRVLWHIGSLGLCAAAALLAELRLTASPVSAPWWVIAAFMSAMPGMIVAAYVSAQMRTKLSPPALLAWRVLWFAVLCVILFRLTMS